MDRHDYCADFCGATDARPVDFFAAVREVSEASGMSDDAAAERVRSWALAEIKRDGDHIMPETLSARGLAAIVRAYEPARVWAALMGCAVRAGERAS